MSVSEHDEQCGLVSWFKRTYPEYLIFAIPNGGGRAITEAKRLKIEGVMSGVFDLQIITNRGMIFFVEMKKIGGKLSKAQKEFAEYLDHVGIGYIVGYGASDASEKIMKMLDIRQENERQKLI